LVGLLFFLFLWELNSYFKIYELFSQDLSEKFFPSTTNLADSIIFQLFHDAYMADLLISLKRILISFFTASILGILVGLLSSRIKFIDYLTKYLFDFFRQLPAVAIIPFAIIIWGIGTEMKIFVAFFGCFFPTFVATYDSLKNVNLVLLNTAKYYRWTGNKLLFGVMLPSALPNILTALRITLSIALILVITAEMLIGGEGLGARLILKERAFDYVGLYSEIILLGILGLLLNQLYIKFSRELFFWNTQSDWKNN